MLKILATQVGQPATELCLAEYRTALKSVAKRGGIGEVLWLTPTHRSAQAVLKRLLDDDLACCWAPGVMTFEQFAERVLRGAGPPASLLNPAERRMLVKSTISDVRRDGELQYFNRVAETRGFGNQLGRFIAELKREEAWPDLWLNQLTDRPDSPKDRELGLLYDRYQQRMLAWDKYDPEGRFWLARRELTNGRWDAFPELQLVVVDGFSDFTTTQQEMLLLLADHAREVLLALPGETGSDRPELFSRSAGTAAALRATAKRRQIETAVWNGQKQEQTVLASRPNGLQTLARNLFKNVRRIIPAEAAEGVHCVAALGHQAETREVARAVKQLLLDGVPAEEISVTCRQPEEYAALVDSVFSDAGLPYQIDRTLPVSSLPLARAFSAILGTIQEDWSYATLKKLLRHTPLSWADWDNAAQRCRNVLHVLRLLNLQGGRLEILRTLQSLASRAEVERDAEVNETFNDRSALYREAHETLAKLDEQLRPLAKSGSYSEQVGRLLAIGRELFTDNQSKEKTEQETPTSASGRSWESQWDLLAGMLRESAEFQDRLSKPPGRRVSWADFTEWLEDQFQSQMLPPEKARAGHVLILNAEQARHLDVPYLFVMGLQEGSFPSRQGQPPFYSEQERRQWNQTGINLIVEGARYQEEMLLFYRLVTRAQRQLTVTYSRVNSTGGPLYASPFYQAVRELFTAESLGEQQVGSLSPVPEQNELLTASDCRLRSVVEMGGKDAALLSWWASQPELSPSFHSLRAAARMNSHRFETPGFTAYEGLLEAGDNRRWLQQRFPADYTFSASRLEGYASCPYRFHLDHILGLDPVQSPRLATDHRRRGNVVHDLLAGLYDSADDSSTAEGLADRFQQMVIEAFERTLSRSELRQALDEVEQQLLTEWADLYDAQAESYYDQYAADWVSPPRPQYRELTFGREDATSEQTESFPPVAFGDGEDVVLVEGRIDRIDVGELAEGPVFNLIDYKTGEPPRMKAEQLSRGTQLQLALYAVAITRLKLVGEDAVPYLIGYWGIREKGFVPQLTKSGKKWTPLSEEMLREWEQTLDRLLPHMVACLRDGQFPVFNDDDHCVSFCPYRMVCRIGQVRAVAEPLQKIWTPVPIDSPEAAELLDGPDSTNATDSPTS